MLRAVACRAQPQEDHRDAHHHIAGDDYGVVEVISGVEWTAIIAAGILSLGLAYGVLTAFWRTFREIGDQYQLSRERIP